MPNIPQEFPFRMVAGTALEARLDARCWGLYVSNYTAQWVEIADANEFVPPNTRQVISLPGSLVAKAVFNAPPGIVQPVAVVGQAAILTYTEREVQPSGGVVGATALAAQVTLERFAKAALPAAGNTGRLALLTDSDRSVWKDTGVAWVSLEGERFNVKQFGAKGDDSTDDTTAINNAIAAVNATTSGAILLFPPGTYLFTTLTPFTKPVWVLGSGRTVTKLHSTASVGVQVGDGSATLWQNIKISDLTIAPTGAAPTKALYLAGGQAAVSFLTRVVVQDVRVDMSGVTGTCDGIYLDGFVLQPTLRGVDIYGGRDNIAIISLAIANMQMVRISESYANNPTRNCLNAQRTLQLSITDSEFDSTLSNSLNLLGVVGFSVKGSILRHNLHTAPVFLGNIGGINCTGGVFEGCYFDGDLYKMISANGTANISVIGCLLVQQSAITPWLSGDSGTNVGWSIHSVHGPSTQMPMWSPPSMVTSPSQLFFGNANNQLIAAGVTAYFGFGSPNTAVGFDATSATRMAQPGVLQILQINTSGAQPLSGSLVYTIMKNGVATALTITVAAGAGGAVVTDLTHQVVVAQGDTISLQAVNNAAGNSIQTRDFSLQLITPGSLP